MSRLALFLFALLLNVVDAFLIAPTPAAVASHPRLPQPAMKLTRKRLDKATGRFVVEEVSEEAARKTAVRIAIANVAAAVPILLAISSGKTIDQFNAPGYAEAAQAKQAKKAAFIASERAKQERLTAQAAEDRASGRVGRPPPKPWER